MDNWLLIFINGLSFGFLLFLLGAGLSIIFGLMGILNMSHGAYYVVGGYVGLSVVRWTGNFIFSILAGGLMVGLLGIVMERLFLRRLYKQELDQVLLTFGFAYIITNLTRWIWGSLNQGSFVPAFLTGPLDIGNFVFPAYRLFLIVFGLAVAVGLVLLQEKTRFGTIIRAGLDHKEMTMGLGINLELVFSIVFFFGAFMAGSAGMLGAPVIGQYLGASIDVLLLAVVVIVIGGLGSLQGALAGSLLIGVIDSFAKYFFPRLAPFSIYLLLLVILLLRPSGILWKKT